MDSAKTLDDFTTQYSLLMTNLRTTIAEIEDGTRLSKILSDAESQERTLKSLKIEMSEDHKTVLPLLSGEMEFLNHKFKLKEKQNLPKRKFVSKWLEAVGIVFKSIGNYFKIPFWDIVQEVVQLARLYN